jgi:hypothetical protein
VNFAVTASPAFAVLASIPVSSTAFAETNGAAFVAGWESLAIAESESTKAVLAMTKYFAVLITT